MNEESHPNSGEFREKENLLDEAYSVQIRGQELESLSVVLDFKYQPPEELFQHPMHHGKEVYPVADLLAPQAGRMCHLLLLTPFFDLCLRRDYKHSEVGRDQRQIQITKGQGVEMVRYPGILPRQEGIASCQSAHCQGIPKLLKRYHYSGHYPEEQR